MIYAIGDIHGQNTMLQSLLEKLFSQPLHEEDTVVFIGDYVDRGENTCAVIDTLLHLRQNHADTIFLRGNHEQMMLDARDGEKPSPLSSAQGDFVLFSDETLLWLQNGGVETLESYGMNDPMRWWEAVPAEHWAFLEATQMEYETALHRFVHAGVLPSGEIWDTDYGNDPRLWIREPFLESREEFDKRVVFGHTPQRSGKPLVQRNKLGIDTGAVFGGPLTAAILSEAETKKPVPARFIQVPQPARASTVSRLRHLFSFA